MIWPDLGAVRFSVACVLHGVGRLSVPVARSDTYRICKFLFICLRTFATSCTNLQGLPGLIPPR
jgi:hypothetical protein